MASYTLTALNVVSALEGQIVSVECAVNDSSCSRGGGCAVRDVWRNVASAVEGVLSGLTIEELRHRQKNMTEAPTYCI